MTTRPELNLGRHLLTGLVAVALFAVMAAVFVQTPFAAADPTPDTDGFPDRTEVANVSVGDADVNATARECDGQLYAVEGDSCDEQLALVTPYTGADVEFVTQGGETFAVATIDTSVTESIGYALFNLNPFEGEGHSRAGIPTEGFFVAFMLIAVLLDAALEGALMLAKRESGGTMLTALRTDGGDDGGER